jgi:hypothetical protein
MSSALLHGLSMMMSPDDTAPTPVEIARRRAIDAVRARLDEISRLASGTGVVAHESLACEQGADARAEREQP